MPIIIFLFGISLKWYGFHDTSNTVKCLVDNIELGIVLENTGVLNYESLLCTYCISLYLQCFLLYLQYNHKHLVFVFTPQPLKLSGYCFYPWCLDGWALGKVCLACISETVRCRKL